MSFSGETGMDLWAQFGTHNTSQYHASCLSSSAIGEELREKSWCCRCVAIPFHGFLLSTHILSRHSLSLLVVWALNSPTGIVCFKALNLLIESCQLGHLYVSSCRHIVKQGNIHVLSLAHFMPRHQDGPVPPTTETCPKIHSFTCGNISHYKAETASLGPNAARFILAKLELFAPLHLVVNSYACRFTSPR